METGEPRGHGHGISRERAGLVDRAQGREQVHDPRRTAKGAHGQSAADDLAVGDEVGSDAEQLSSAAAGHAETADDFVEDQQRSVFGRQFAQVPVPLRPLHEQAVVGWYGLHDDRRDLISAGSEEFVQGSFIVEVKDQGLTTERFGHASRGRCAEGDQARARVDKQVVGVAVVATGEFEHEVAAGKPAGQADGAHGGLGARGDEA